VASHAVKPAPQPTETPDDSLPTLAEVLDRVSHVGPQIVTRGEERFIVLGAQDFEAKPKRPGLVGALLSGPRFDGIVIAHAPWDMRDIDR